MTARFRPCKAESESAWITSDLNQERFAGSFRGFGLVWCLLGKQLACFCGICFTKEGTPGSWTDDGNSGSAFHNCLISTAECCVLDTEEASTDLVNVPVTTCVSANRLVPGEGNEAAPTEA